MCGPLVKMWIPWTSPIFVYFSAKTDPETEVLGREKTETEIPLPPNTTSYYISISVNAYLVSFISGPCQNDSQFDNL